MVVAIEWDLSSSKQSIMVEHIVQIARNFFYIRIPEVPSIPYATQIYIRNKMKLSKLVATIFH